MPKREENCQGGGGLDFVGENLFIPAPGLSNSLPKAKPDLK